MAITQVNTTKTIKQVSSVLGEKCEMTQLEMEKLMAAAGAPTYTTVRTMIPRIPGSNDDVVFVGLNGIKFYFQRGKAVDIPRPILEIMYNCHILEGELEPEEAEPKKATAKK